MILDYPFLPSPHYSSRRGCKVLASIVHYDAGGRSSSTRAWLLNPLSKVSYHFHVARDGGCVQLVDTDQAAWHAGASEMVIAGVCLSSANLYSVGIGLANRGYLHEIDGQHYYELAGTLRRYHGRDPEFATLRYDNGVEVAGWWEPYPGEQIEGLQKLLLKLKQSGFDDAARRVVGHDEIAMPFGFKKRDPGAVFPWANFSRNGSRRTHNPAEMTDASEETPAS